MLRGVNLNSRHKSILDRCVRKAVYRTLQKAREKHIPTMFRNFNELLLEHPEEMRQRDIALSLVLIL